MSDLFTQAASSSTPDHATILRDNLAKLNANDQSFANSLLRSRFHSDKQRHWIKVLAERATETRESVALDNVAGIVALLARGASQLKRPKIIVRAAGQDLRLSIAGETSRHPGTINVTEAIGTKKPRAGAVAFGNGLEREWFGRIHGDGRFEPSPRIDRETRTAITLALKALAHDPAGIAASYGKLTGNCCFCSIPLTDERSVNVGYGRICATRYGLPWGE